MNYMPKDESLGEKGDETLVVGDRVDKETALRIDKMIRAFYSDTREAVKIIPKKSTMDLEAKLRSRMERLKLRTEMGIVSILKEKIQEEKAGQTGEFEREEERNGGDIGNHQNGNFAEAAMIVEERRLQAIEDNLKVKEAKKFEDVLWIDELEGEKPANYKGDLVSGILMLEKMNEDLQSDSEDN